MRAHGKLGGRAAYWRADVRQDSDHAALHEGDAFVSLTKDLHRGRDPVGGAVDHEVA